MEQWNTGLLYKFSEDQCVDKLESNVGRIGHIVGVIIALTLSLTYSRDRGEK